MLLGSPCRVRWDGNSVGTAVLLVLLLTLGALLIHLIYCKGPTPSSAWCCHLRAEQGVSFCRHLVTTEPANQSGCPMVAALSLGTRTDSFGGNLCSFLWQSVFVSNKLHCTGQRKHSHSMHFRQPFHREKQWCWEFKGDLDNYCSFWELDLKHMCWINKSLTLSVCVRVSDNDTNAWVCKREEPKRETFW